MPHRFFLDPALLTGTSLALPTDVAHQVARVLRLRVGDGVTLLDGEGNEYAAAVTTIGGGRQADVRVTVGARSHAAGEPAVRLHLYLGLLKGDHFSYALQKAVECGVAEITPLLTARTIVSLDARDLADGSPKMLRWREIVREAAEQSRRGRIPVLHTPQKMEASIPSPSSRLRSPRSVAANEGREQEIRGGFLRLIAWEGGVNGEGDVRPIRAVLDAAGDVRAVDVFIGPEGGFTADEVATVVGSGGVAVGLGARILRAETAAPVATALVLYHLGQMD